MLQALNYKLFFMKILDKIKASLFQKGVDCEIVDGSLQIPKEDEREVEMFLMGFRHTSDLLSNIKFI